MRGMYVSSLDLCMHRTFVSLSLSSACSMATPDESHKRTQARSPETEHPPPHFSAPPWFCFLEKCTSQGRRGHTRCITNHPSLSGTSTSIKSQWGSPVTSPRAQATEKPPAQRLPEAIMEEESLHLAISSARMYLIGQG